MIRTKSITFLLLATVLAPAQPGPRGHEERREEKRQERELKEDRKYWREHDKREERYWRQREREEHRPAPHRYLYEDRRHRPVPPPWMEGYWRPGEHRRYVALVPGDPSRMWVFIDGRWVLRLVRDPRARIDLEGAFTLPFAAPPVPPPRLGLNFHIVLFP